MTRNPTGGGAPTEETETETERERGRRGKNGDGDRGDGDVDRGDGGGGCRYGGRQLCRGRSTPSARPPRSHGLTSPSTRGVRLLGPNGAGKTTAIRCITTLLVPTGMVRASGTTPPANAWRYAACSATDRAVVRRRESHRPGDASLFALRSDVARKERAARVEQALAAVDLTDAADRLAKTYSGGMVRRLELAQALVSAPRLLILDEPTIGLDPIARTSVWEHINAVRAATGMTVLATTRALHGRGRPVLRPGRADAPRSRPCPGHPRRAAQGPRRAVRRGEER